MNKRVLCILYIVLAVSFVNAALINVTTFIDGLTYANITSNSTKEIQVGIGITAINANLSSSGYIINGWCYQETATQSTSCGGLSTGNYTFIQGTGMSDMWGNGVAVLYDGDYSTYSFIDTANVSMLINYTKPTWFLNTSLWQIKDDVGGIRNITIPSSCWDFDSTKLVLKVSAEVDTVYRTSWYCQNKTNWHRLNTSFVDGIVYEEGMWWNVQNNITNPKIYINNSLIFSHTGNYNTTNNSVSINLTELNYYLKNNGTVPLKFTADAWGGYLNIFDLSITYQDLAQCGSGVQAYNVTLYDEDNQTELVGKMSIDFTYGNNVLSFNEENTSSIAICLSSNNTYTVSGTIFSETDEYLHKKILVNTVLNNVTQYIRIYNSYDTTYSSLSYYLKQYNYENYVDVIGRMQRYFPLNHTWITVQEDKSDEFGRLIFDIREINTEYRFLFYDSTDTLLDTTSTLKFVCVSGACDVTSIISDTPVDISAPIVSSSTYNNATGIVTVTWNDPSAATTSVNVIVSQISFTETVPICNYLSFGSSGSYNCNVTGYSGNIMSMIVSNSSLSNNQISSISYFKLEGNSTLGQLLDVHDTTESSLFSFVIITVFVGIGLISGSPIGVLVMVFAAVFFIGLLGLSTIVDIAFLGVVGTMALFVSILIRRRTA